MADLSIFKLDNQTITIKDTTARQAAESAKTLATTASGNATTALNKINELESEKADTIISSTSGAIASFPDGAARPVDDLTVQINPVQDLHGYDHPWPAGGGKNLFNSAVFPTVTRNGITCTNNGDGSFTFNGTAEQTTYFDLFTWQFEASHDGTPLPADIYRLTGCPSGGGGNSYFLYTIPDYVTDYGNGTTMISAKEVRGGSFCIAKGYTCNNVTVRPMIRVATNGDDTFAPYSNICPITGWTGAKVTRTGKNLIEMFGRIESNMLSKNTFVKAGTYTASAIGISGNYATYIRKATTEGSFTGDVIAKEVSEGDISFTLGEDTDLMIQWYTPNDSSADLTGKTFQLEVGSTATAYEPYSGQTYPITFPSSAGTVYGGTLDVTSGVLTVTDAQIASYAGETLPGEWISDRDVYAAGASPTTGAQVVYELATPVTYQLTPQEITTLLGQNNIWADTGDMSVTYRADTKLYIDNKFTELQTLILENLERRNRS